MKQFYYCVCKYDPAFRDEKGAYKKDEWTDFSDIGRAFEGKVFTEEEYYETEDRYVAFAFEALKRSGDESVRVTRLENYGNTPNVPKNGTVLSLDEFAKELRRCLRSEYWCCFEGDNCSVDVGYDYYMHITTAKLDIDEISALTEKYGLFIRYKTRTLDENTVRVIKIGKDALYEFIRDHMGDETEQYMDVDDRNVTRTFVIDFETCDFIFCVSKAEDKYGNILNLSYDTVGDAMKNIPYTTKSLYQGDCRYRDYTRKEIVELSEKNNSITTKKGNKNDI